MKNILIVGAGLSGATCAAQLAQAGHAVHVIEERAHIGGNAYDEYDQHGVLIHKYGPHIFHTNSKKIFEFLSQFTQWRPYEHKVAAFVHGVHYPMPLNFSSIGRFFGVKINNEEELRHVLDSERIPVGKINTAEDYLLTTIGRSLMEAFFAGYSKKQWGTDLGNLDASIVARVPLRYSFDDRYFLDVFQGIPLDGYTQMIRRMLDHPLINLSLGETASVKHFKMADVIIYTGAVDRLLGYCFGPLPYRSLRFEYEHHEVTNFFQKVGTINYPSLEDGEHTRITEFKHLTGQKIFGTTLVREYSSAVGDPCYPIPSEENRSLYDKYVRNLNVHYPKLYLTGRLAEYRYYNMDQAIGSAMALIKHLADESIF